jgi:hypothetical protein
MVGTSDSEPNRVLPSTANALSLPSRIPVRAFALDGVVLLLDGAPLALDLDLIACGGCPPLGYFEVAAVFVIATVGGLFRSPVSVVSVALCMMFLRVADEVEKRSKVVKFAGIKPE